MKIFLNGKELKHNTWQSFSQWKDLRFGWDSAPDTFYTLLVYDMDAPSAPFLHMLIINIPGDNIAEGTPVISSLQPAPPANSGQHRYVFEIFSQSAMILPFSVKNRSSFNVQAFSKRPNLYLADREVLVVDSQSQKFYRATHEPDVSYNPTRHIIRGDTVLTDAEQRYCSCVIDVAAKQPGACNLEKAWFEMRDSATCYNPYAVCASRIGTTSRNCGSQYNYEQMSDSQLIAFANLSQIQVPAPFNRQSLLRKIHTQYQ